VDSEDQGLTLREYLRCGQSIASRAGWVGIGVFLLVLPSALSWVLVRYDHLHLLVMMWSLVWLAVFSVAIPSWRQDLLAPLPFAILLRPKVDRFHNVLIGGGLVAFFYTLGHALGRNQNDSLGWGFALLAAGAICMGACTAFLPMGDFKSWRKLYFGVLIGASFVVGADFRMASGFLGDRQWDLSVFVILFGCAFAVTWAASGIVRKERDDGRRLAAESFGRWFALDRSRWETAEGDTIDAFRCMACITENGVNEQCRSRVGASGFLCDEHRKRLEQTGSVDINADDFTLLYRPTTTQSSSPYLIVARSSAKGVQTLIEETSKRGRSCRVVPTPPLLHIASRAPRQETTQRLTFIKSRRVP
jgi:hypothetical protein